MKGVESVNNAALSKSFATVKKALQGRVSKELCTKQQLKRINIKQSVVDQSCRNPSPSLLDQLEPNLGTRTRGVPNLGVWEFYPLPHSPEAVGKSLGFSVMI